MYLILIASLILETGAVVPCEKSTSLSLHLCSTASKYDRSFPYEGPPGNPTEIANSIALHSVAQVKEDEDMITLNLLLSAWWNDTRLTLKQHGKSIQGINYNYPRICHKYFSLKCNFDFRWIFL